jgi:hypothetical protein
MPSAARFSAARAATAPMSPGRRGPGRNRALQKCRDGGRRSCRCPRRRRPRNGFVLQKWSLSRCGRRDRLASLGHRSSATRSCGRLIIPQPRDYIDVLTTRHGLPAAEFFSCLAGGARPAPTSGLSLRREVDDFDATVLGSRGTSPCRSRRAEVGPAAFMIGHHFSISALS